MEADDNTEDGSGWDDAEQDTTDDDNGAGVNTKAEAAISSISALVGAGFMGCAFMSYRSYKTRGRPTAW